MENTVFTKIATHDTAQQGMIHDAQYDYYGQRLATCSSDGTIKIIDVTKPEKLPILSEIPKAHSGPCWQLAWAHPSFGSILASCGFDNKVIIYKEQKLNTWEKIGTNTQHKGSVNSIAFAPWECGLVLAAGSSDGQISVWKYSSANTLWEVPLVWQGHEMGINSVSWQPFTTFDDTDVLSDKNRSLPLLASGSSDHSIKIWKMDEKEKQFLQVNILQIHNDWVRDVAWCPAFGNPDLVLASCGEDTKAYIIQLKNQKDDKPVVQTLQEQNGPCWRLSWSLNGNMLAVTSSSANAENVVHVFQENQDGEYELISDIEEAQE